MSKNKMHISPVNVRFDKIAGNDRRPGKPERPTPQNNKDR
jgi:hypothetical protein